MTELIAEQLDADTGAVTGARTVQGSAAKCVLVGNELATGVVDMQTESGPLRICVSSDARDYQQARVYENGRLVESLLWKDGTVVYVNETTSPAQ
jgi:hypothetical protein